MEVNGNGKKHQERAAATHISIPSICAPWRQNHGFQVDNGEGHPNEQLEEEGQGGGMPQIVVHKCSIGSATIPGEKAGESSKKGGRSQEAVDGGRKNGMGNAKSAGERSYSEGNAADGNLTGRMRSLKFIGQLMAEECPPVCSNIRAPDSKANESGIANEPTPKLDLTMGTVRRKLFKQQKKGPTIFHHIARFHNKFGIRHFVMIALLAMYSVFGGLMFEAIEREHEIQNVHKISKILDRSITRLICNISGILGVNGTEKQQGELKMLVKQYYLEMLKIEGKYIGSVFHKYETLDMKKVLNWYFGSSVFYAMTLFTTIGYGTIACQTTLGKIASVFYSMFGIPLMLVVLSDLGQLMLRFFVFSYERGRIASRNCLRLLALYILDIPGDDAGFKGSERRRRSTSASAGISESESSHSSSFSEEERCHQLPLFMSVTIALLYLLLVSFVVSTFDWDELGPNGLEFGESLYFTFFSLSTIGLGDVMPNNLQYSPILAIFFLFGLALLSVVNSTVYTRIQETFLCFVGHLEEYLTQVNGHQQSHEGYFVFKSLGPTIQLLVLALPIFPDEQEDRIGAMLEPENTELGRRIFSPLETPSKLARAHSMGAVDIFRPTLGILNTAPASPKRTFGHHEWRRIESLGKRGDWPAAERRRATTISWLANPKSAELAKTWNWEDQQKMEQQQQQGMVSNEGRKVQRIYTRRGEPLGEGRHFNVESLRRVQSERLPRLSLPVIDELAGKRRRRQVFGSPSPRRMRRTMKSGAEFGGRKGNEEE